jgi:hypothetical protein
MIIYELHIIYDNSWTTYNLWQLMITYDNLWQLMITYDNLWQLMITYDNLWSTYNLWQLMNYIWFMTAYDKL